MPSPSRAWVGAGIAVLITGCATVDSADLRTSGISAHVVVRADRSGSTVVVDMTAGGLTSIELTGEDSLTARSGTIEAPFDESTMLGHHEYTAQLPGVTHPGTEVTVVLQRGPDDTTVSSTVLLPPGLQVVAPPQASTASRRRDLLIQTNHADGRIRVSWEGSCVAPSQRDYADDSAIVVPAGALVRPEPIAGATEPPLPADCLVTLTVTRIADGSLGDGYDDGSITAERGATVVISSRP